MGLFSKSVTQVGTQVSRVIEDDKIPNSIRDGVVENLFDDEGGGDQMMEYILDRLTNSIGLRAGRMYDYGKSKYIFGLPQASLHSSLAGKDATQVAIQTALGTPVSLSYYHFGRLNNLHLAWMNLVQSQGYNSATNQLGILSTAKGLPVFLADMQLVVTNATLEESTNGSLDVWGTGANAGPSPTRAAVGMLPGKPTPFAVDPNATGDYVIVTYAWEDPTTVQVEGVDTIKKVVKTDTFTIPMTGYDLEADYHQARYVTSNGVAGYWIYKFGTGTSPEVDAVFNTTYSASGTFFPFGYFRYNKQSTVDNTSTAEFASSKKLFNYLNMDFETVGKGINENPDIKDVEQAMLMMAVPANTTNPMEQRYLFDFFNGMQASATYENNVALPEFAGIKLALNVPIPATSIVIQDKRFKMALSYSSISKNRVAGKIGAVDTYASGTNSDTATLNVPVIGGMTINVTTDTPRHWYRHQLTDSIYEEVIVYDLKMTYWIFENYTTTGDGTSDILLIPVDVAISEQYSVPDREVLYARALHYVFNSRVVTKLKWYQTGIFKAILIIASIVITIISLGSTWETIVAAAAIGATAVAMVALQLILRMLIMRLALRLFVKVVGAKFALIAALVAAAYGTYNAIEAGSLAGAPWARDLLSLSTGLTNAVSGQIKSDMNDLLNQSSEYEQYIKDQTKLLDDAQALLDPSSINPLLIFGESPNDFYQRTVHSGNIGVLGIDAISSYVDIALQLPKLSQTLGDTSYV